VVKDSRPIIVWGDDPAPEDAGGRPIMRVRWQTQTEAEARS
jgi:hypothetical protein